MKAKSDTTMQILTLHDAIQKVLVDTKVPMTTRELADYINDKSLYLRKDGNLVTASQVMSRIGNYPDLFLKKGRKVTLKGLNKIDLLEEEIRNHLSEVISVLFTNNSFDKTFFFKSILKSIVDADRNPNKEIEAITAERFFKIITRRNYSHIQNEIDIETGLRVFQELILRLQAFPNRNRILTKLSYWLLDSNIGSQLTMLPEYLGSIIGKLNLYSEHTDLFTTENMLNTFEMSIFENNPEFVFSIYPSDIWSNSVTARLNGLLRDASFHKNYSNYPKSKVGIITPPWGIREKNVHWSSNFLHIMKHLDGSDEDRLNKAVLIVPEGASFSGGRDFEARKILTNRKFVETITSIPFHSSFTSLNSVLIITFNFDKVNDHVLFSDFTRATNFDAEMDWERVSERINGKTAEEDVSAMASVNEIIENDYDWSPKKYLVTPESIKVKKGHSLYRLEDLLVSWKRGRKVDRKKLYKGGEVKYLRTTELSEFGELVLDDSVLGIDHDELDFEPVTVRNSIAVSMIGNKLKNTLLPEDTPFLIDGHLSILEVNTDIVLPEFLNNELSMPYVQNQLDVLRIGTTIPRLNSKGLLSILVQIPSLAIQKDQLLQKRKGIFDFVREANPNYNKSRDNVATTILHNYLGIIKHTMMQPLATLEADIDNIDKYIKRKVEEGQLNKSDFIYDLLAGEKEEDNEASRVTNTLNRLSRAINEAQWRFTQSEKLLKIETSEIDRQKVNIKEVLEDQIKAYSGIDFKIKGKRADVMLDAKIWSILIDNLVDNAKKHGFKNQEIKKILFDISIVQNNEGVKEVVISYFNNGLPLPSNFNLEKFISNGVTSDKSTGDGFGGYLIHSILKKHDGRIEVLPSKELDMDEYNVCFKIYLKEY